MQDGADSEGYRLSSMTVSDAGHRARATVELSDPEGDRVFETAEGDGPVDALFAALAAATGVDLVLESYQVHSVGLGADARGAVSYTHLDVYKRQLCASLLDDVVIVREAELRETVVRLALEENIIAEGAGALALAAGRRVAGKRKCAVVSGGNIDAAVLALSLIHI